MRLVKFFAAALWALSFAFASAAYADPPTIIGRLNHLTGPVSFAPGEAPDEWVAAQLNRPVTSGDRLWTDNSGFAELRIGSLAVRMAPQTSMDILALDDRAIQLRVAQGNLNLRVRRLPGERFIEVATPAGAVVIRQPGSYRVSVDPKGDFALVAVRAGGQAQVFTAEASVLVRDGEEAELSGSRAELYAVSQADEFDRWAWDRDQRFDRIGSTRYVSMEMTGYEDLDYYGQWRTVGQYGNVWVPNSVPDGWAPYRHGHWVWISPWGWTWVDDQPWGFAPSHYGRWVYVDNYWAWTPGRIVERPIYSPALVAFIGGAALSVGISSGPSVGWVPLGYREPYIPWYTASRTYVQNVNVVHNVTNVTNVTNIRYVNRSVANAVTVVPRQTFVAARPVQREVIRVDHRQIATAPVTRQAPVARPERTSLVRAESGSRPPAQVIAREAVTVHKPAAPQRQLIVAEPRDDRPAQKGQRREQRDDRRAPAVAAATAPLPPVRVIERREPTRPQVQATPPRAENRAARQVTVTQAPRADAPAQGAQPQRQEQAREQQGERIREQKEQQTDQQKAQAAQQLEQLERDRKQREGQAEQQRQATERERGQKAAQDRQRQEEQRAQQERERGQKAAQDQQRQRQEQQKAAQEERERGQKAAQDRQRQEEQRAQQERERGQKAAQEERERGQKAAQDQQRQRQEQERAQREQAQQKAAQEERERGQKAAQDRQRQEEQRAQQERERGQKAAQEQQQRQRQEQERAQREQQSQKAAQEQQRAQREQQERERGQKAAQDRQRQEQERAQREQQSQKAAQEQQRAQREQQERERGQKAAQDRQRQEQERAQREQQSQKAAQERQRAQREQQSQKAAQEQQRAAQQQQRAQQEQQRAAQQQAAQKAAQEQQRAQQQQQQRAQQAAQAREQRQQQAEEEKGKRKRPDQEG